MKFIKALSLASFFAMNTFALSNHTWVLAATVKMVRINGSNGVFKINEVSPPLSTAADPNIRSYFFSVNLTTQEGRSAYAAILMAKYSGQQVQFLVPSGTPVAALYPVQNFTLGIDN